MPTYLWSGKDRYGNQIVQRLTTETVAQSKELLLERGYTDLILHTTATEIAMREPDSRPPEQTAEEELTMRNKGAFRWSEPFTRTFKESPVLSVLLLAGLGLGVYRRDPWTTVLCSIALA